MSPLGPCSPVSPLGPCAPVAPVSPFGPCAPVSPFGPCAPVAPVSPFGPCAPVAPVSPFGPLKSLSFFNVSLSNVTVTTSLPSFFTFVVFNPSPNSNPNLLTDISSGPVVSFML